MTWKTIIEGALVELGVLQEGEDLDNSQRPTQTSRSLDIFNGLLGEWSNEGLYVPSSEHLDYTVSSATQVKSSYSISSISSQQPDISFSPPVVIEALNYQPVGWPYSAPLMESPRLVWSLTPSSTSKLTRFFYDRKYPSGTLIFDGITKIGDKFTITGRPYFVEITATTIRDDTSLPPGFDDALRLNLAARMSGSYGVDIQNRTLMIKSAQESKDAIVKRNMNMVDAIEIASNISDKDSIIQEQQR